MILVSTTPGGLTVDLVTEPTGITITVAGELDFVTADALVERARTELVGGEGPVTIDAGQLTFCDSAGISALVQLRKLAEQRGRTLRVVHAQESVWRVLDYSGLREYLNVE